MIMKKSLLFPLTSIPGGANIESAMLRVYSSTAGSSAPQLKALADLTSLVGDWVSGAATNYGLVIRQDVTEDGTVAIVSLEDAFNRPPMLRVIYTTP